MTAYAHTFDGPDGRPLPVESGRWQPLIDHLRNVATRARGFAEPLGLADEAEWAGWMHDLGKYAERFQARLRNPAIQGINHWAAGATNAAQGKRHRAAFAIDGHHTGLPARAGLCQSVLKMISDVERPDFCRCPEPVAVLLDRLRADGVDPSLPPSRQADSGFAEAFRTRLMFSCLVDADFLDTEEHFSPGAGAARIVPPLNASRALQCLLRHLDAFPPEGDINRRRRQLLADCLAAALRPTGLFTLTAPTGSGKTLASLAFALRHVEHHNASLGADDPRRLVRIIVVIPYTSIIEQTAHVFRDLFEPEFGPDYILEHHASVAPRERTDDAGRDAEEARLRRARLASENWASPVVVTTSVQFFESLFANQPSQCRKLHHIARSVVLFDEVQTLPPKLVPSLLSGVNLLVRDYGVTAVFMTATQPAFAVAGPAILGGWNPAPIASDTSGLADALRRTRIQLPARDQILPWDDLARSLAAEHQVLCVVNTTAEARALFLLLRQDSSEGVFHLSARLCPRHRREKLARVRARLRAGLPCRLVATQLVEAGVDLDFPAAFRALGPLDSIIQTAGRCNREGRCPEPRPVVVFRPPNPKMPRGAYATAAAVTESFLDRHQDASDLLHRPEFYAEYFGALYGILGPESPKADAVYAASDAMDFPQAAAACRLVGDETRAVLVPWGDGAALAQKLERDKHLTREECRVAQQYSVNLYQSEFAAAQSRYLFQPAEGWDFWVWNSDYDDHLGIGHLEASQMIV